ncbi:MAG: protein kinase family protein [Actinomycetaceae bacterium]|nr:protein kinase family protein [Actinomycetaceae bacterium]
MGISRYKLVQPFTVTSTGTIWQALDEGGQSCLIRYVPAGELGKIRDRLLVLERVESEFIAPIIDAFDEEDRLAVVVPLVEGQVLHHWMHLPGALTEGRVAAVLRDIALGLRALHEVGVGHGDLSLSNVIVGSEGALLIDYMIGSGHTPGFAAPEVLSGASFDELKADIWSWGAVARELHFDSQIVERALSSNPDLRPTIDEVLADAKIAGAKAPLIPVEADTSMLSAGELLRIEASLDHTVATGRRGGRHARKPARGRRILASALVFIGLAALGYWWVLPSPAPKPVAVAPAEVKCPTSGEAQMVVSDLTTRRNAALMQQDPQLLDESIAGDSEVREKDVELIEKIAASGIEIKNLTTKIDAVEIVQCSPLMIAATFTQEAHERCEAGECVVIEEQAPARLKLTFEGPPWKVNKVESLEPQKL